MKARVLFVSLISAGSLVVSTNALAKTASCPCSPCKCSPCTCGGGGGSSGKGSGKSDSKHRDHERGRDRGRSGSSVGVGLSVDLGGVGQRPPERDPFAVGGGEKPVARTEEKRTTKRKEQEPPKTATFDEIKLTGKEAKGENNPPNTFNIDNEQVEEPKLPPNEVFTREKPKTVTKDDLQEARDDYFEGVKKYREDNWNKTRTKDETKKILKLRDEFDKTDEGKKAIADWKEIYDKLYGSGIKIGTDLMPPPQNEMEKKKYEVAKAQEWLESQWKQYDWLKDRAPWNDEDYKRIQRELEQTTDKQKQKELEGKLKEAREKAENKWASSDEAKEQMKKVHEAEKELDKAKEAWKPFEKYEEKKAASNP